MPEPATAFRMEAQQDVGLVEIGGWSPDGLAAIFRRQHWPLPARPGETARHGEILLVRLTPSIAWAIGAGGDVSTRDDGCACDLSHSRVRLRLAGKQVTETLSRVVALDLDERAWPAGAAAATAIHGVPVLVHRGGAEAFDILVPRSFARSIGAWIAEAAPQSVS